MDYPIIRAKDLHPGDKFIKSGTVYIVRYVTEKLITYYSPKVDNPKSKSDSYTFGRNSQEKVELIERNNFDLPINKNKDGSKSKPARNGQP